MSIQLSAVIIDAADPAAESAFWQGVLGGSVTETPTHAFVQTAGLPVFVIQRAPDQVPPGWPDGPSQQLHVDLTTDDLAAAERRVVEGGGRRLSQPPDTRAVRAGVYASPAGHPFCLREG